LLTSIQAGLQLQSKLDCNFNPSWIATSIQAGLQLQSKLDCNYNL